MPTMYRTVAEVTKGEQIKVSRETSFNQGVTWIKLDSYNTTNLKIENKRIVNSKWIQDAFARFAQPSAELPPIEVPTIPQLEMSQAERAAFRERELLKHIDALNNEIQLRS